MGCIPLKSIKNIKGYDVCKVKNLNTICYVFESNSEPWVFLKQLKTKFNSTSNIKIKTNSKPFVLKVSYETKNEVCLNLFNVFNKNNQEIITTSDDSYFFYISVSDENDQNVLIKNHIDYQLIINYLNELTRKYHTY